MEQQNIYLTGFMGSGKSTIGQLLAKELAYQWIDLDDLIIARNKMSIAKVFSKYGERFFRKEEATVLRNTQNIEKAIISTGGGTPCFENNMTWINQHGLSIFIDPAIPVLLGRLLQGQDKRPLLRDKNPFELEVFIRQKLAERRPVYEQAHLHYTQEEEDIQPVQPLLVQIKSYYAQ
ncbi:MAG: shikimate kinase [Saprospiraceae bacterium]